MRLYIKRYSCLYYIEIEMIIFSAKIPRLVVFYMSSARFGYHECCTSSTFVVLCRGAQGRLAFRSVLHNPTKQIEQPLRRLSYKRAAVSVLMGSAPYLYSTRSEWPQRRIRRLLLELNCL